MNASRPIGTNWPELKPAVSTTMMDSIQPSSITGAMA
jgi:hypothetical protein